MVEKVGLAALCAFVVGLLMLMVLGLFVDLDWGRAALWLPALLVLLAILFLALRRRKPEPIIVTRSTPHES